MDKQQDRKKIIETLDRTRTRLRIERASLNALTLNVSRLEDLVERPGFLNRTDEKRQLFTRRLASARTALRNKASEVSNIEAEVQNLNNKLAG